MQAIELLFAVEDPFGVSLPDEKLTDAPFETAGSLWPAAGRAAPDTLGGRPRPPPDPPGPAPDTMANQF